MHVFNEYDVVRGLKHEGGKIVMLIMDGLGGLPMQSGGPTELEAAQSPQLDRLAAEGMSGLMTMVRPGLEPGSGPGHLSLFGYDPIEHNVQRGVFTALGTGFDLQHGDITARGNFCTVDENGVITDRRAGRIGTEECTRLAAKLHEATHDLLEGYEIFVRPVKEHRFNFILRGPGLGGTLSETDPLEVGKKSLPVKDLSGTEAGAKSAELINRWVAQAQQVIADEHPANSLNLRGIGQDPKLPQFDDIYGLKAAAIAVYPMYKGAAKLAGMEIVEFEGARPNHEIDTLAREWENYDFFFVHIKKTDSYGEDGNFDAKKHEIEAVDAEIERIRALNPDVLIVTGDHSTPAALKSHSWHPVPVLMWGKRVIPDLVQTFGERAAATGGMGHFHGTQLMPLAMAHAGRLKRYGA